MPDVPHQDLLSPDPPPSPDPEAWRVKPARPNVAGNKAFREAWNECEREYTDGCKAADEAHAKARHELERRHRVRRAEVLREHDVTEAQAVRAVRLWNRM
jgi:hypothetical protein